MNQLCLQIRQARINKKLSQNQLAKLTGIAQTNISRIERRLHEPSKRTLKKLYKVFTIKELTPLSQSINHTSFEELKYNYNGKADIQKLQNESRERLKDSLKKLEPNFTEEFLERYSQYAEKMVQELFIKYKNKS